MDGCEHYVRRCKFVANCCNKIYGCRHCHNKNENHEINRYEIKEIVCSKCDCKQEVSNLCKNCGIHFANYFCKICNFFDDRSEKGYYHCDKCNLCRVGHQKNFIHCDICNTCVNLNGHKCKENVLHSECPVCLENLFFSTKPSSILQCGHPIHVDCMQSCLEKNNIVCPLCRKIMITGKFLENYIKGMDKLIEEFPIQEELNFKIKCNDCGFNGEVKYHPYGMKCGDCGGYNTTR